MLDAAEALLSDKSFEDIHVTDIAAKAEISVAAFYRRFNDKDALLHALHERLCQEGFATAEDALRPDRWESAGIAEIITAVIPFLIQVMGEHESLDRAIYQRAISDAQMRERSTKLMRHVVDGLSSLLMARSDEIRHPDPELAVSFALVQAVALLTQHYTVGIREIEPVRMSDARVAAEISTSCLAYLGVREPYAPFTGTSDLTDILAGSGGNET